MSLFNELKRRKVFKVAAAYIIVAWLLLQVSDTLVPALHLPDWFHSGVAFVLILGFPVAIIFAWAFELTPDGLKREHEVDRSQSITHETSRKLDFIIIGMMAVALAYFAYDKLVLSAERDAALVEATTQAVSEQAATEEASTASDKTIAVLAFVNMSDDPDNEYFSDGISEEILNLLAKVSELRVTSRSSAFSFKGQNVDVPTIAAKLNVAYVLEGSVRKAGNQLRITAQLIDVVTDTHLWSETYDKELKSVFAIQDEIAAAVVDALKITLLKKKLKVTETNPEAYTLYLQGRYFNHQGAAESNQQAETLLLQALEIDPGFAPAWAELGSVYERQAATHGLRPTDEGNELARHAIQQALAIDPQYGPAYAALAMVNMFYDWDFATAFQHLQQALALNPGDATILSSAARLNRILGRIDEAIELQRKSVALDPVWPEGHYRLGQALYLAHRLDEAEDSLQLALSLNPSGASTHYQLALVLLAKGEARAAALAIELETSDYWQLTATAIIQYALGDAGASGAALEELMEDWGTVAAYQVAMAYAFRGEIDPAFDWLERAYENRDAGLTHLLLDPMLVNLHDDPRWESVLGKMGFSH